MTKPPMASLARVPRSWSESGNDCSRAASRGERYRHACSGLRQGQRDDGLVLTVLAGASSARLAVA